MGYEIYYRSVFITYIITTVIFLTVACVQAAAWYYLDNPEPNTPPTTNSGKIIESGRKHVENFIKSLAVLLILVAIIYASITYRYYSKNLQP